MSIHAQSYFRPKQGGGIMLAWVGVNDETYGLYTYVNGAPLDYSYWRYGHPSAFGKCVYVYYGYMWSDDFSTVKPLVCEIPPGRSCTCVDMLLLSETININSTFLYIPLFLIDCCSPSYRRGAL